jgi:hypothetical protein
MQYFVKKASCLQLAVILFQFFVSVTAFAELYIERPDILVVEAKAFSDESLPKWWRPLREGHFEAVAEIFGLYSDPSQHLYFLARDAELLYDYARLMADKLPELSKFKDHVHLLNISRANMNKEHVEDYLAQEGISEEALSKGLKPVFVDTGFAGTIPSTIQEKFPKELRDQMITHLMCSSNRSHPSTRVFLQFLNPAAHEVTPSSLHGSVIDYEHMPRFTYRSTRFEKHGEAWVPAGDKGIDPDGSVNQIQARAYMEDLKEFAIQNKNHFLNRVQEWSHLFSKAHEAHQTPEYEREKLRKGLEDELRDEVKTKNPIKISKVRDFLETLRLHYPDISSSLVVSESDLGLDPITRHRIPNKLDLIKKYPQWKTILQNPPTEIKKLVDNQDIQTLGSLLDVAHNKEVNTIAIEQLSQDFSKDLHYQSKVKGLITALIEKGDPNTLRLLARYTFSAPHSKGWIKQLDELIQKADQDVLETLAMNAFSKPHSKDWIKQLDELVQKADQWVLRYLAQYVFSNPHSKDWTKQLDDVIQKADQAILERLAEHVFSKSHSKDWTKQLDDLIQKADQAILERLARYVFSVPHSKDWTKQLDEVIQKANKNNLRWLADSFSKPHSKDWTKELKEVIRKGELGTLLLFNSNVFSQRHAIEDDTWKKLSELVKAVIRIPDSTKREQLLSEKLPLI